MPASIILVRPQMGENIGAAARVMLNFGFTNLRLVSPRDGWPNEQAIKMSSGAIEKIHLQVFENFTDAIADLDFLYATTSRMRDMNKEVVSPVEIKLTNTTGIIFGPERTGLENTEISVCNKLVCVPVNPDFSSLNLAQTVAIIAYQLSSLHNPTRKVDFATNQEMQGLYEHFETELAARNFFSTPEKKPGMMQNIMNLFSRASPSPQEVRTLRGIIRCLAERKNL